MDPRYRGAAIPSKAFRLLQSMTGPEDGSAPAGAATVKVTPAPVSSGTRSWCGFSGGFCCFSLLRAFDDDLVF